MSELENNIQNNRTTEIPVYTQTRKRGRPHGSTRKEPGQTTSVHVPERVREWLSTNRIRLSDYVSQACNWYDLMTVRADELRLANQQVERLIEERTAARREVARLNEENLELLRSKTRTMDRLAKGDVIFK